MALFVSLLGKHGQQRGYPVTSITLLFLLSITTELFEAFTKIRNERPSKKRCREACFASLVWVSIVLGQLPASWPAAVSSQWWDTVVRTLGHTLWGWDTGTQWARACIGLDSEQPPNMGHKVRDLFNLLWNHISSLRGKQYIWKGLRR